MGLVDVLYGKKIYLDANIFIYVVEHIAPYNQLLYGLFEQVDAGNIIACTSALTLSEVLVKPFVDKNTEMIDIYQDLLLNNCIILEEVSQQILIQAAKHRAKFGGKLPDAIHLMTSKQLMTDFFLTNDKAIKSNIKLLQLSDFLP